MEQLIPVINKLQDVFSAIGQQTLDLPQITVVGSQSAGKSSVLENIVGRDFLPRGSGICTRRPLVLQLYPLGPEDDYQQDKSRGEEWGEFLHLPGQRIYDFDEIRAEIQRETDRLTGRNKGISSVSINLKIYSPHVLNLTLVDLPGITKVPTGDQPEDVEEQIRSMCYEFISNPNAIILAVSAANQDLANSEGLKMARAVDPDGIRTIGVLTKVDIMDQGTDCCDVLTNKVIPLRRGYVAVINRSQKDVQDNVPIRKGLAKEAMYFQSHPRYRNLLNHCGTPNMARILNQILMSHIRDCLPDIKARINKLRNSVQANILSLGECIDDQDNAAKGVTLLRILSQFSDNFSNKVEGKRSTDSSLNQMSELYGGARVAYIFNESFGKRLKKFDAFDGLSDEDIRTAIANANGTRPSLFVPEISFDLLVRRQIIRLEQPGLDCLDLVHDEVQMMVMQCETMELSKYPELRDRVFEVVNALLRSCMAPAQKMISNLIQIELAYINTSHPDFVGGKAAVTAAQQSRKLQQTPPQQQPQGMAPNASSVLNPKAQPANGGADNSININGTAELPKTSAATVNENKSFFGLFQGPQTSAVVSSGIPAAPKQLSRSNRSSTARTLGFDSESAEYSDVVKLPQVPEKLRCSSQPTDKERVETEIIKTLISSYFDIVKKNFTDLVPKTVMRFLVLTFKEALQNHLVTHIYREDVLTNVMRETEDIASKRKAYKDMRDLLTNAVDIVNEVRDFQPAH